MLLVAVNGCRFIALHLATLALGYGSAYGAEGNKSLKLSDGTVVSVTQGSCSNCDFPYQLDRIELTSQREWWGSGIRMPEGNGAGASTVLHTVDGGKHWVQLLFLKNRAAEEAPAFFFLDSLHGWLSSFDSWNARGSLYWTVNGGRSWKHTASDPVSQLQFFDARHGHFAGTALSGGFFGTTSDGGATWTRTALPLSHVDAMSFVDSNAGIVIGTRNADEGPVLAALVTHDGGLSWDRSRLPTGFGNSRMHDFVRSGGSVAFLAAWRADQKGSELLESRDGGRVWERRTGNFSGAAGSYILAAAFTHSGHGYIFYRDPSVRSSLIALSTDEGRTWKSEAFPLAVTACKGLEITVICSSGMDVITLTENRAN
jgi:photosystem II stability/assembly factor-like uncharacterized protein